MKFLKGLFKGLLYVILSPLIIVGFLLYAVYGVGLFIFEFFVATIKFFKGEKLSVMDTRADRIVKKKLIEKERAQKTQTNKTDGNTTINNIYIDKQTAQTLLQRQEREKNGEIKAVPTELTVGSVIEQIELKEEDE